MKTKHIDYHDIYLNFLMYVLERMLTSDATDTHPAIHSYVYDMGFDLAMEKWMKNKL